MTLPQETIERIKTEASRYAYCASNRDLHTAYEAGAAAEAEKAQVLVEALKEVQAKAKRGIFPHLPVETMGAQMCIEIDNYINEKLASYKEKEGGK